MAIADRFVANRKETFIAAPHAFVVITTGLVLLLFRGRQLATDHRRHAAGPYGYVSGDFGLLSYFACHPDLDIVTWDDRANNISYFTVKNPANPSPDG